MNLVFSQFFINWTQSLWESSQSANQSEMKIVIWSDVACHQKLGIGPKGWALVWATIWVESSKISRALEELRESKYTRLQTSIYCTTSRWYIWPPPVGGWNH